MIILNIPPKLYLEWIIILYLRVIIHILDLGQFILVKSILIFQLRGISALINFLICVIVIII